jgi:hypothetical protein
MNNPSIHFHPDTLLQWLSFMPRLETLAINFLYLRNRDMEGQFRHTPATTLVTLPNLHYFTFRGDTTYLEALVHQITPCPEKLEIGFAYQRTFSIPRLLSFMNARENLKFETAKFKFLSWQVSMAVYPRGEAEMCALSIMVGCFDFSWQVSSVAQFSDSLSPILSAVEHLILEHEVDSWSSEEHNVGQNEVDRQWHKLFSFFSNVKTLRIDNGLVEAVSRSLLDDGEFPLELLPELQELTYSGSGKTGDTFTSFIHARQNTGRPITVTRC